MFIMPVSLRQLVFAAAVVCSLCAVSPCAAETVGVILTHDSPSAEKAYDAFVSALKKKGYGDRLELLTQKPYPDPISWSNASRKLIATDVDVLVTFGSPASLAAAHEKPRIPIVYAGLYAPLAKSLKLKNMTGVTTRTPVSSVLRYLKSFGPLKELGVFYSSWEDDSAFQYAELDEMSKKYGFNITRLNLKRSADISGIVPDKKFDAFFITSSFTAEATFQRILNMARNRKVPTASIIPPGDAHAVITLYVDPAETGSMAAEILIKIIKGKSPKNIKPLQPKSRLIFSMKEANELGVKIPMNVVTEATKIIYK